MSFFKKKTDMNKRELLVLNGPLVLFDDLASPIQFGQWSQLFTRRRVQKIYGIQLDCYEEADILARRHVIPEEMITEATITLGNMLGEMGFDSSDFCTIKRDKDDSSIFHCHSAKLDENFQLSFRWGNMDNLPEITIDQEKLQRRYEYLPSYEDRASSLTLSSYTIKKGDKSLYHFISPYDAHYRLSSPEYTFTLNIDRPSSIQEAGYDGYQYHLDHEKELEEYLLHLSFPIDIAEVYKAIQKLSLGNVSEYPTIKMSEMHIDSSKNGTITSQISLKKGELVDFIITRNGNTIMIDHEGVNYQFRMNSMEELNQHLMSDHYFDVKDEVQKVKQLTDSLFRKNQ